MKHDGCLLRDSWEVFSQVLFFFFFKESWRKKEAERKGESDYFLWNLRGWFPVPHMWPALATLQPSWGKGEQLRGQAKPLKWPHEPPMMSLSHWTNELASLSTMKLKRLLLRRISGTQGFPGPSGFWGSVIWDLSLFHELPGSSHKSLLAFKFAVLICVA